MSTQSSERMTDELFETRLREFMAVQASQTTGAPSSTEIAERISDRMRPRFIFSTSPQLVWLLLIGLVLVALISAAVAGSRLFRSPELLPTSSRTTEVAAGWYFMPVDYTPERFAFDVPRGWSTSEGYVFKGGRQTILEYEVSFVTWGELTHVFGDLCDAGQLVSAGTSADELTSALARQNGREVTGPEQVTVDGRVGKVVHLLAASDLQCPRGGPRVWPDPGPDFTGGMLTSAGQMDDVYAFDLDQGRLVIVASFSANASAVNRRELKDIVSSIRFLR